MMSFKSLSRALPRCSRALSSHAIRGPARLSACPLPRLARQSRSWQTAAPFSTSVRRCETESQVNDELAAKLGSELSMEKDMRDSDSMPQAVKEYIRNSAFEIHDTPGKEEVVLTRKFGDEDIRVAFSIEDLNNVDEDPDQLQDSAMMDELDDPSDMPQSAQSGGANTKGAVNQGRTSGGNIRVGRDNNNSPADRPELDDESNSDEQQDPSFPAHVFVTIKRAGKGALQIEAIAQDGLMAIENVYYYKDAKLADPESINSDWEARTVYSGPPFGNLDEDLQVLFERYLEERGINTTMALFVPDYIDYKEQREYLSWLESVKSFVE